MSSAPENRSLRTRFRRMLDVREDEKRPLGWAILLSLIAVASAIICRAVGDAIFLTAYPLSAIPRFFIISNAALIAGALAYSAAVRVVRPVPLNVAVLSGSALSMFAARWMLPETGASPLLFTIVVWLSVVAPMLNILAWNTVADHFDSRQGRRLFPIVFAGSTVGAIAAGAAIAPFVGAFGVENLLWVLGGLIALAIPIPSILAHLTPRSDRPSRSFIEEGTESLWQLFKEGFTTVGRSKLLRTVALVVFLAALVTNLIDFAFKGALQARYTRDEIGVFYGWFNAIGNTGNLLLQLFVVAWAIERFGIRRVFKILPFTLLAGTLALIWLPGFITIVALKLADGLLRFTFQNSANEVVIAPVPYVQRNRAKILIKGAMNPLGAILAGVLLVPFASGKLLPESYLFGVLFAALAIWFVAVNGIGRTYADALYRWLRAKQPKNPDPASSRGFGGDSLPDPVELMGSSARWESTAVDDESGEPPPSLDDKSTPEGERPEDLTRFPAVGLSDASPLVRRNTLELLVASIRRKEQVSLNRELLEGLLWREIHIAFAIHSHRHGMGDVGGSVARRVLNLLGERLDDCHYRIFMVLGLLDDVHRARTAWFALNSEAGRTRAHAVDLVDASFDSTPFQRALTVLLDEMSLAMRLEKASRIGLLDEEVFQQPLVLITQEHDPQLNRLLMKL